MAANIWSFVILGTAGITGWLALYMLRKDKENARLSAASSSWPTAPGLIYSATVDKKVTTYCDSEGNENESTTYEPRVEFSYTVGGTQYSGTRVSFARLQFYSEKKANAIVAKFPAGATAPVAYDPQDPKSSVLDRDIKASSITWQTILLGVTTLCIAILGIATLFMS